MQRKVAWIATIALIMIFIVLIAPFIVGIYFEKNYKQILTELTNRNDITIRIEYKRGWIYSKSVLILNLQNENLPKEIILDQTIQHGPILYHAVDGFMSLFGLATIQNQLRVTPEIQTFFAKYHFNENSIEENRDYVTFFGSIYKHIKLATIQTTYPATRIQISLNSLEGKIWFSQQSERLKGSFILKDISVADQNITISIPLIELQFDQNPAIKNMWLGKNSLHIPEITWNEANKTIIKIEGINFNGFLEENSGLLNGMRELAVHKMDVEEHSVGPFHIQLSVNKLNLSAILKMVEAYQEITERGELYQSQLSRKLMMMLPTVINQGSQLKLDNLDMQTPEGMLQVNGEMAWNMEKIAIPDNMPDLMQSATAEFHLRISKPLIEKWIQFVSSSSFFNPINPELQETNNLVRKEINSAMRQNANAIFNLRKEGHLSEDDALVLLLLQKKMVPMEEYNYFIRQLLLDKAISLETSHMLLYWYSQVMSPAQILSKISSENKETIRALMHSQIQNLVKAGYLKQEDNDYVVKVSQDALGFKVNEKLVMPANNQ